MLASIKWWKPKTDSYFRKELFKQQQPFFFFEMGKSRKTLSKTFFSFPKEFSTLENIY